jgi:hypothetical protein
MTDTTIALSDEQAVEYGFAPAPAATSAPVTTEVPKESAVSVPETVTAPTADKTAESVSPKVEDIKPSDGGKPLYTLEEVEKIIAEEERTGKSLLDSSRLSPGERLTQRSLQRGSTKKFELAKKMLDEANRIQTEYEQAKRDEENRKIFDKESDELGPEMAQERKERRELLDKVNRLEVENQRAQNSASAMQITNDFRKIAPNFHIPTDEVYENMVISNIIANNVLQTWKGEAPKSLEESAAITADALGFTNVDNLWKIIRANPENEQAVKKFYVDGFVKEKAKGPTVSPSSSANVPIEKKTSEPNKSGMDAIRAMLHERHGIPLDGEINLT